MRTKTRKKRHAKENQGNRPSYGRSRAVQIITNRYLTYKHHFSILRVVLLLPILTIYSFGFLPSIFFSSIVSFFLKFNFIQQFHPQPILSYDASWWGCGSQTSSAFHESDKTFGPCPQQCGAVKTISRERDRFDVVEGRRIRVRQNIIFSRAQPSRIFLFSFLSSLASEHG
jgi:hypothetical protein